MRTLLLLPLLAACAGDEGGPASTCTDADSLAEGVVTATVSGSTWESDATWLWQGESVQITAAAADGWNITFVGRTLADGTTVKAAADAGSFPIEVVLAEGGGGWALAYPSDGDSYSTDAGSGTLVLTGLADDVLAACFDFVAARENGDEVEVVDGAVRAVPFEM